MTPLTWAAALLIALVCVLAILGGVFFQVVELMSEMFGGE